MIHHPEQKPDEIYMGNAQRNVLSSSSWATSRLGENALDSQGKPIIQESWHIELKPWFIKIWEVENRIEQEKASKQPNYKYIIEPLQNMVKNRAICIY